VKANFSEADSARFGRGTEAIDREGGPNTRTKAAVLVSRRAGSFHTTAFDARAAGQHRTRDNKRRAWLDLKQLARRGYGFCMQPSYPHFLPSGAQPPCPWGRLTAEIQFGLLQMSADADQLRCRRIQEAYTRRRVPLASLGRSLSCCAETGLANGPGGLRPARWGACSVLIATSVSTH